MFPSFTIISRAESGSRRTSEEIEFSVLNRKCGLIWLCSASMRACSSSRSCCSSFISMRTLFSTFSAMATAITVPA